MTPEDWFSTIPWVTKRWFILVLITALVCTFNFVNNKTLALDYVMIVYYRQYWRLITCYFFMGTFSFNFLIQLGMLIQYSRSLEQESFDSPRQRLGYLHLLFVGWVIFNSLFLFVFPMPYPSTIMIVFIGYIWSRKDPFRPITFYGFTLKAWHLPFIFLFMDLLFGAPLFPSITAILVGHFVHFMQHIVPMKFGPSRWNILVCPDYIYDLSERLFTSQPVTLSQRQDAASAAADATARARPAWAQSAGHRLG